MSNFQLTDIQADEVPHEDYSLREITKAKKVEVKHYEVEHKELSKNIQKFDKKPRVYTEDPYSFNSISLKKVQPVSQTAEALISNPLYNQAGKILGVDTVHDWNLHYDKVQKIVDWAKKKVDSDKPEALFRFIYTKMNQIPSIGTSKLNDLYIYTGISK